LIFDRTFSESDIHFGYKYCFDGLAIELKTETGKVTKEQEEFMRKLTDRGWACEVCWSVDEFVKIIDKYYNAR
jgi:hypothetical protein